MADGGRPQTPSTGETEHWPIPSSDPGREHFLALRYPRLRSSRQRAVRIDTDHYNAGKKQGRCLELHAGLERQSSDATILPLPQSSAK